jgi:4-carboxymuconolactone decarboxylase
MTGDLTIRGVTKEVVLTVDGPTPAIKDPWGNYRVGGQATTKPFLEDLEDVAPFAGQFRKMVHFAIPQNGSNGGTVDDARYRIGLATARNIDPEGPERLEAALKEIAPDLYRYIVEFAFGDILSRQELDPKTREIATVSALAALGNAQPQLRFHLNAALHVGCSRAELAEVLMQMSVYAGIPAALNALYLAQEVFAERDAKGLS